MQIIELEEQKNCKSKTIIHAENIVDSNIIHSVNYNSYSDLTWEDIAGLDWNIIEGN